MTGAATKNETTPSVRKSETAASVFDSRPSLRLRLTNGVANVLKRCRLLSFDISADDLLVTAAQRTGVTPDDPDQIRQQVSELLDCFDGGARLTWIGLRAAREELIRGIEARLLLEHDLRQHPEIRDIPVPAPIVIVGLPRTGKTLIQSLLTQDSDYRWLRHWELETPFPVERDVWGSDEDPRRVEYEQALEQLRERYPNSAVLQSCEGAAECSTLFFPATFQVPEILCYCPVKKYRERTNGAAEATWLKAYEFYRMRLQHLQWLQPGRQWVLNSPHHTPRLDYLLRVFPDAKILQVHRSPVEVIPALCRLTYTHSYCLLQGVTPQETGRQVVSVVSQWAERSVALRRSLPDAEICDVRFRDLIKRPLEVVHDVHNRFNLPFSQDTRARVERLTGEWEVRAEAEGALRAFGLDYREIESAFGGYCKYFNLS